MPGKYSSLLYPDYVKTTVSADREKVAGSSLIMSYKIPCKMYISCSVGAASLPENF